MKIAVVLYVARAVPCKLTEVLQRCLLTPSSGWWSYCPDNGRSKHLRNISQILPDFTEQHRRKKLFSVLFFFLTRIRPQCPVVVSLQRLRGLARDLLRFG
jgi:hypothetical protein